MQKNRNAILIIVAVFIFVYIALLSLYPAILSKTFDKDKFEKKAYKATGLVTYIKDIDFKVEPNLSLVVTIYKWSSKYIDAQDCFDSDVIVLTTNLFSPFTKTFKIKDLFLKHARYSNQILMPEKVNKLDFLPKSFDATAFGTKKITIEPKGPVRIYNLFIKNIAPGYYKEDNRHVVSYSKDEVKDFLIGLNIRYVHVK